MFLLPGEYSELYIFEERYKQLVEHCQAGDKRFGIAFLNRLNARDYGSLVELVSVEAIQPDGSMDILVRGLEIFQLRQFHYRHENALYPAGSVDILDLPCHEIASLHLRNRFKGYLRRYEGHPSPYHTQDQIQLVDIANYLPMDDEDKSQLSSLQDRQSWDFFLLAYLQYLGLLHEQEEYVYHNLYLN